MHYDVVIIGAGMSGLAAGIRLAYFDKRVCIVEKHHAFGGLNSYYRLGGREFDVGLHAVTNYAPRDKRSAPLNKLLRQLRLTREEFDLREQRYSEVRFPQRRLRFTNDVEVLIGEVGREFPAQADNFQRLLSIIGEYDDTRLEQTYKSARGVLGEVISDPALVEMLLCPLMYYGSAEENDMDFTQFVTMFKSIFLEGFARPREGVRKIVKAIVRKFRACGGKLMMNDGVERIEVGDNRVAALILESGEALTADVVFSSAGYVETMRLCPAAPEHAVEEIGQLSFVETIAVMDETPLAMGHGTAIVFFNDAETFTYARPDDLVDLRSGVVCCPSNYRDHEDMKECVFRVTWLADYKRWLSLDEAAYAEAKKACHARFLERAATYIPRFGEHVVCSDMFTPKTIHRYTGHLNGAVYGSPRKRRDGRTPIENLFICGTDQGFLGIIGAMLSGITIANLHVLARE